MEDGRVQESKDKTDKDKDGIRPIQELESGSDGVSVPRDHVTATYGVHYVLLLAQFCDRKAAIFG